jgi:DNA mismatch endonuclease, patch repair protein
MSAMARTSPLKGKSHQRRPAASSEVVRRRMQGTLRRDTPCELALRSALHRLGLRFSVDRCPLPTIRRRADVLFRSAQVAVFVDGCFWHGCPIHGTWPKTNADWWHAKIEANRCRDAGTNAHLKAEGWAVVRAWAHDDPTAVARRIARLVRRRRVPRGRQAVGS